MPYPVIGPQDSRAPRIATGPVPDADTHRLISFLRGCGQTDCAVRTSKSNLAGSSIVHHVTLVAIQSISPGNLPGSAPAGIPPSGSASIVLVPSRVPGQEENPPAKRKMLSLNYRSSGLKRLMSTDLQIPSIAAPREASTARPGLILAAHLRIARLDHSIKQAFILPGILLAIALSGRTLDLHLAWTTVVGLISATLIASSNYVLNEVLDAPFDRLHPTKKLRPAACGLIHKGWAYTQWIGLMLVGMGMAWTISTGFAVSCAALWLMGCIYNISPVRSKDLPYLDVLSESVNNPIRFCLGWYIVTSAMLPPLSLLVAYWMLGAYFMALKRFSEYRQIDNPVLAGDYRKSFHFYTAESLLTSVVFYAAAAMLFFGAFAMRYRIELILCFPVVAWLMAIYFNMAFAHESPVQNPEKLYREPKLMIALGLCVILFALLLFIHIPWLTSIFPKSQV